MIARLAGRGRRALASACGLALLAVLWGQRAIGPGTRASWQIEYVAATVGLVGLLAAAVYLIAVGARPTRQAAHSS
jgi:predicted acyltransferase